jgi:hypothetical protein
MLCGLEDEGNGLNSTDSDSDGEEVRAHRLQKTQEMVAWLQSCDIVLGRALSYAGILYENNIPNISKLSTKLARDRTLLHSLKFDSDDIEDIIDGLQSMDFSHLTHHHHYGMKQRVSQTGAATMAPSPSPLPIETVVREAIIDTCSLEETTAGKSASESVSSHGDNSKSKASRKKSNNSDDEEKRKLKKELKRMKKERDNLLETVSVMSGLETKLSRLEKVESEEEKRARKAMKKAAKASIVTEAAKNRESRSEETEEERKLRKAAKKAITLPK